MGIPVWEVTYTSVMAGVGSLRSTQTCAIWGEKSQESMFTTLFRKQYSYANAKITLVCYYQ